MSLLSAKSRAPTTYTTIALRSLAGPCGAFDVHSDKIPPDLRGGSLDSVRDWPASRSSSFSSDSDLSTPSSSPALSSTEGVRQVYTNVVYPHTPPHSSSTLADTCGGVCEPVSKNITSISQSTPRDIPIAQTNTSKEATRPFHKLSTPPLTPEASPSETRAPLATREAVHDDAAHEFLARLFPGSARLALSYAKSFRIASSELRIEADAGFAFEGVIFDLPGCVRTLYVDGKGAENVKLRESIVALLDLADEHLKCSALVIALERSSPALGGLLHSFMYAGATVVTRPPYPLDNAYVLVGIEI